MRYGEIYYVSSFANYTHIRDRQTHTDMRSKRQNWPRLRVLNFHKVTNQVKCATCDRCLSSAANRSSFKIFFIFRFTRVTIFVVFSLLCLFFWWDNFHINRRFLFFVFLLESFLQVNRKKSAVIAAKCTFNRLIQIKVLVANVLAKSQLNRHQHDRPANRVQKKKKMKAKNHRMAVQNSTTNELAHV